MKRIFIDAVAWIALLNSRDSGVAELRDDRRSAVCLESPLNPPSLGDFECLVPPDLGARGRIHPCFQQRRDSLHQAAKQLMMSFQQQDVSLVTTEFVLLELADALSSPANREVTVAYVKRLRVLDRLTIIPVSQALLIEGWTLYSQRADKDWGLTDCISFVVMSQQQLTPDEPCVVSQSCESTPGSLVKPRMLQPRCTPAVSAGCSLGKSPE